jgi:hypothetical protein
MDLKTVRDRVIADFLMPSRLDAYEALLRHALDHGYAIVPIERYWDAIDRGAADPGQRYLLLRHDIDTDPGTAGIMWQIEHDLGVRGSFFFRLSTLDVGLMQAIAARGGEASYHYEELATVAKARHPRTAEAAEALLPEARDLFAANLARLRAVTGLSMSVVASHGDFLNRRLGVKNTTILADPTFRDEVGITLETYDEAFLDTVTSYHRDLLYPDQWMHGDPYAAIDRGERVVYLLIHPRSWRVDRMGNLRDDVARVREDLAYRIPRRA